MMNPSQPNIILIITDQQRYDTINALGYPFMKTPNLDRLVREGVSFDQCHVSSPLCVPSRASLFNGLYPHTTGIQGNGDRWTRSWVEQLAEAGYHCVNVGKMHAIPVNSPLGFHQRYVVENKDRFLGESRWFFDEWDKALAAQGVVKQQRALYRQRADYRERLGAFDWELPERLHSDFFVGDTALWWLDRYPKTEPLFLQIGFPGPHPPYDPVQRYAQHYLEQELPILGQSDQDLSGQPARIREFRQAKIDRDSDSIVHLERPTKQQVKRQRAYYLANVTMIDEKVGQILEALSGRGYLENAVVIFLSDHGDCLSDHGHSQKNSMYDCVTRVPALLWSPGRFDAGRHVPGLCQLMDVGATVLELAGVAAPAWMEAQSLLPAVRGEHQGREHVFAELEARADGTGFLTMVRSSAWKLVDIAGEAGQLFDLDQDPDELHNLWADPAAAVVKGQLYDVMREWRVAGQVKTRQWTEQWR